MKRLGVELSQFGMNGGIIDALHELVKELHGIPERFQAACAKQEFSSKTSQQLQNKVEEKFPQENFRVLSET